MIISYKHKFVFLHAAKTGGSSIALALYPHLGPDDIIIGTQQHAKRHGLRPNRRTLRLALHPSVVALLLKETISTRDSGKAIDKAVKTYYRRAHGLSSAHAPPEEVRRFMGPLWDEFHKFAFARNPWDWMVSVYYWRHRRQPRSEWPEFEAFVETIRREVKNGEPEGLRLMRSFSMFFDNGKQIVDSIGRFEHMESDFRQICQRIGLPTDIRLPVVNKNKLRPPHEYRQHYNDGTRTMVEELFAVVYDNKTHELGFEF
ncbi:sulfotransferase family 2 domain-containing protein [Thiococcus pfennigii]|uniref:sulfotransferase family 2 domain-containing protein n=1 Tax=Thiococcus pfennigii TaxID=1057 RepID=UPI001905D354|nr:sulfotransferase family 2 domain-containing protein [Thiococcus pfennigii]MBK1699668.1 hypothetical protein [Thiococcus pfennigii]MBK1733235.1 hypothetical protein [Thiococcus pfennigii]